MARIKGISMIICAAAAMLMPIKSAASSANVVTVDTDYPLNQAYFGGAMQWEPNDRDAMTEAQWARLLSRVKYMNLGFIRCCIMPYYYCFGYKGNEPRLIWNMTDTTGIDSRWYNNAKRYMDDLYRLLDFCQKNGIDVLLGEWWKPMNDNWKQVVPCNLPKYTMELDDPRYAAQVAAMVSHLVNDKGFTCVKQFNLGNEVNLMSGDPKTGYSWEKWKTSIENFRRDLDSRGLGKIGIVGPDGGYWGDDVWFNKTLDELGSIVDIVDYHWYINKDWTMTNRVEDETRSIRFFTALNDSKKANIWGEMGIRDGHYEFFDQQTQIDRWWYGTFVADALIQTLRSGWSAAAAWGMDDAMHYRDDLNEQKRWGFWNSIAEQKGKPEEAKIRPWFYTWSLMSRSIPKGSELIHSTSFRSQHLNCVAAKTPSGDITFAMTNTADFEQSVVVRIPNVVNKPTVCEYVYFKDDYPVDGNGYPQVKKVIKNADFSEGVELTFPAKGFILITTQGGTKPEIRKDEGQLVDCMEGLTRMCGYSKNLGINGFAKFYDKCQSSTPEFGFDKVLDDHGTIHPSTNDESAYICYKLNGMKNFVISVSGQKTIDGRFKVYGSADGKDWKEIAVAHAVPELSINEFYHTDLMPKVKLAGMNYIKIEMLPLGWFSNTRVRKVIITK